MWDAEVGSEESIFINQSDIIGCFQNSVPIPTVSLNWLPGIEDGNASFPERTVSAGFSKQILTDGVGF